MDRSTGRVRITVGLYPYPQGITLYPSKVNLIPIPHTLMRTLTLILKGVRPQCGCVCVRQIRLRHGIHNPGNTTMHMLVYRQWLMQGCLGLGMCQSAFCLFGFHLHSVGIQTILCAGDTLLWGQHMGGRQEWLFLGDSGFMDEYFRNNIEMTQRA